MWLYALVYPKWGLGGSTSPLNLQNVFFELCVCKIYSPNPAPILINSKFYTGKR